MHCTFIHQIMALVLQLTILNNFTLASKHAVNDFFANLPDCNFFKLEDGQKWNAYQVETGSDHLCCMCPKGTFLERDCIAGNLTSRKCSFCPFDENDVNNQWYMSFGPHHQRKCRKADSSCGPDMNGIKMTRIAGSREKPPICMCPAGMDRTGEDEPFTCVEKKVDDVEKPIVDVPIDVNIQNTPPPSRSTATVTLPTESSQAESAQTTQTTTTEPTGNDEMIEKPSVEEVDNDGSIPSTSDSSTSDVEKTISSTDDLPSSESTDSPTKPVGPQNHSNGWKIAIPLIIGLILATFGFIFIYYKYKLYWRSSWQRIFKCAYQRARTSSCSANDNNDDGHLVGHYGENAEIPDRVVPDDQVDGNGAIMARINTEVRSYFPSEHISQLARNIGLDENKIADLKKEHQYNSAEYFSQVVCRRGISPQELLDAVNMFNPPLTTIVDKIENIIRTRRPRVEYV